MGSINRLNAEGPISRSVSKGETGLHQKLSNTAEVSENEFDSNNNDGPSDNLNLKSHSYSLNNNNNNNNNSNNNVYPEKDEKLSTDTSPRTSALETRSKQQHIQKMKPQKYIEHESPKLKGLSPQLAFLCTAIYSLMPPGALIGTFVLLGAFFTRYYYLALVYVAYLFLDRNTCNTGGRRLDFVYNSSFWSYLGAYFPIKLRYTSNFKLDAQENYILSYSPHGISAFGAVAAFATDGLGFSQLFPGIKTRFLVHERLFSVPVMKETCATRGDCSVNSNSIDILLSNPKSRGNLLTLVVGGLAEADLSHEEILKIFVAERKGFVKKALIHGAHIIPCIAFGENSVFKKINFKSDSLLHRLESKWYELFKFKHPIYYGRSFFSSNRSGVMAHKRPITVVLGDPIPVIKSSKPTQSEIDATHARYLESLRSIYNSNQDLTQKYDKILQLV